MRSFFIVTYLILFSIVFLPALLVAYTLGFINKQLQYQFTFIIGKHWSKTLLFLAGTKVEVKGLTNIPDGPVLFVGNHTSWFDIPLINIHMPYPAAYVAKKEMKKAPILNVWMQCMDCLFLDRKNLKEAMKTILTGVQLLKKGHSLVIFPQGTRCKQGETIPFKQGSLKLAEKAQVPIVPIAIKNSADILENNGLKVKKANVCVTFGEPIMLDGLDIADKKLSAQYVQNRIENMLKK